MFLNIIQSIFCFSIFYLNSLSAIPPNSMPLSLEVPNQVYYLQPVNEDDIPKLLDEMDRSGAQQAWLAGLCSSENEALDIVKVQTKNLLTELQNKIFFEEWSSHNFLFNIFSIEHQAICGYIYYSTEGKEAFIESIFLEERCRGKGFATNILNDLEAELKIKGFDCIRLHVFTHNVPAINLYKKLGYEVEKMNEIKSINMIKVLN